MDFSPSTALLIGGLLFFALIVAMFFDFMTAGEAILESIADWWKKVRRKGRRDDASGEKSDKSGNG
ncbi:MAG: hypothetical protein ACFB21_10075 [Opitutales bacterium]